MGLHQRDGKRITRAGFPAVAITDAPQRITENVYQTEPIPGAGRPPW